MVRRGRQRDRSDNWPDGCLSFIIEPLLLDFIGYSSPKESQRTYETTDDNRSNQFLHPLSLLRCNFRTPASGIAVLRHMMEEPLATLNVKDMQ